MQTKPDTKIENNSKLYRYGVDEFVIRILLDPLIEASSTGHDLKVSETRALYDQKITFFSTDPNVGQSFPTNVSDFVGDAELTWWLHTFWAHAYKNVDPQSGLYKKEIAKFKTQEQKQYTWSNVKSRLATYGASNELWTFLNKSYEFVSNLWASVMNAVAPPQTPQEHEYVHRLHVQNQANYLSGFKTMNDTLSDFEPIDAPTLSDARKTQLQFRWGMQWRMPTAIMLPGWSWRDKEGWSDRESNYYLMREYNRLTSRKPNY